MPAEYNIDFVTSRSSDGALGSVDAPVGTCGGTSVEAAIGARAGGGFDSSAGRHATSVRTANAGSRHSEIRVVRIQRGNACARRNAQLERTRKKLKEISTRLRCIYESRLNRAI